ncbi:unnamed protein product [Heligmosomoides polygyrus]|uniref:Endo/exonuclease/phosphatase domain-containing protein n=1 Tax=Heligmosomoides polygyrus TaxID=6339 RepID=A0A183GVU3_HELPZ|nr:unnamed protein product [Heligmosomoides polygyrus]
MFFSPAKVLSILLDEFGVPYGNDAPTREEKIARRRRGGPAGKSRDVGRGFKAVLCGSPRTTSVLIVAIEGRRCYFFSVYAQQTGCSEQTKDEFWSLLDEQTAEVSSKDVIFVAGDLNGHVGATKDGYSCHGGFGYGSRNADVSVYLSVQTHMTSPSGDAKTQIDHVLVRRRDQGLVTDAKTVPYESVATQHRPLIYSLKITPSRCKHAERWDR